MSSVTIRLFRTSIKLRSSVLARVAANATTMAAIAALLAMKSTQNRRSNECDRIGLPEATLCACSRNRCCTEGDGVREGVLKASIDTADCNSFTSERQTAH